MATLARIVQRVFLHQTMAYWQKSGSDPFGKPLYLDPVELPCRWEDKQQEIVLSSSRKVISRGYLLMANPVLVGSIAFLGTIVEWQALETGGIPPTQNQGGSEILLVKTTPDIKNRSQIYEIYL